MKFNKYIFFISIFLISIILRVVNINNFPPSLNWDEVSLGYNSYSILKTGKDEWGNVLPLIFRAYGDYKLPLYIYLSTPFVFIFGLNALSIKLVSILAGSILPIFIFLIINHLFPKKNYLAILGSLITLFSPWSIFLSRIALEANLFLLLFTVSLYFLIKKNYVISTIFYGLSLFTYNSSRVLLPFFLILLIFLIIRNKYNLKKNLSKFLFFIFTIFIFLSQTFNQSGQARYKWVTILDEGAINKINELRQQYPRFLVNKATYFTITAANNYISHFDPSYIFYKGGSNYQFNIPNFYLIIPLFLPFFIIGVIELIYRNFKDKKSFYLILLAWLLISPIPSSVTRDAPHTLRSITLFPIVTIIIVIGINKILSLKKYYYFISIFILIALLITQFSFWKNYQKYSYTYSSSWQFGYKQMVQYIKENGSKYDNIYITKRYGEPHEFILFHWPFDPNEYQNNPKKIWDYHANWYWVDAFDKYKFINDWEIITKINIIPGNQKNLLITSPNNYNQNNTNIIKTIYNPNQEPVFVIGEIYDKKP